MSTQPSQPSVSHLVLNVRNIEASHHFYTEMLGFVQCGELNLPHYPDTKMRFYRGNGDHHHDIALVEIPDPASAAPPVRWTMFPEAPGIVHIAIGYATRDEWLSQIEHLQRNDVEFIVRGNHGMTHSAYIADPDGNGIEVIYDLPKEVWEGDVDAALNYFENMPRTGAEALTDSVDYKVFTKN